MTARGPEGRFHPGPTLAPDALDVDLGEREEECAR